VAGLALAAACVVCQAAGAIEVRVSNAWVHSALEGQPSTEAYMNLHADKTVRLIGASTAWATRVELTDGMHTGAADTALGGLEIPADKDVQLTPGSYHLVLVGVGREIANGTAVPITLEFEDGGRTQHRVEVTALARGNMFPPGPPPPPLVR